MSQKPDGSTVAIFIEIGVRNSLSAERATLMAEKTRSTIETFSDAKIFLMIGGYDDDPRGLWEVAEVREYVEDFAAKAGLKDGFSSELRRFSEDSICILTMCGVFGDEHPYHIIIED